MDGSDRLTIIKYAYVELWQTDESHATDRRQASDEWSNGFTTARVPFRETEKSFRSDRDIGSR